MTLENITPESLARVERILLNSLPELKITVSKAVNKDITIDDAVNRINRIGTDIDKAIYPEDHEP